MTDTDETPEQRTSRLLIGAVYALTAIVGAVVAWVSSVYLHEYALAAGMTGALSWSLVVALDAGGVCGTLVWVASPKGTPARVWGRGIALGNLAASVLGNVLGHLLESNAIGAGPWVQILTGAVYPTELMLMIHLGLVFHAQLFPTPAADPIPVAAPEPTPVAPPAVVAPAPAPAPIPPAARPIQLTPPTPPRPVTKTAPSQDVTRELVEQVRSWRAKRIQQRKPVGRRSMLADPELAELGLTDSLARKVLATLEEPPHLAPVRAIGGSK